MYGLISKKQNMKQKMCLILFIKGLSKLTYPHYKIYTYIHTYIHTYIYIYVCMYVCIYEKRGKKSLPLLVPLVYSIADKIYYGQRALAFTQSKVLKYGTKMIKHQKCTKKRVLPLFDQLC